MGRAFEYRKARKFKRWNAMSKAFTRIGKDIAMAVKAAGPDPDTNTKLRAAIANAKGVNMPKDRVEAAIKRASSKDEKAYEEVVYEGYAPYGIAVVIETATDNTTRTVANIRSYFNKHNGALGKTGSLDFIFTRKGVFEFDPNSFNLAELELDLIDNGAEDIQADEDGVTIITAFEDFAVLQKFLESNQIEVKSAQLQRIPNTLTDLTDTQAEEVLKLIEKFEDDDDVQAVYHNMVEH